MRRCPKKRPVNMGWAQIRAVGFAALALLVAWFQPSLAEAASRAGESRLVYPIYTGWNPTATLARGIDFWANGEKAKALKAFQDATKVCPRDPIAWHNLGVTLLYFTRTASALDAFRHEWFLWPSAPSAYFAMGECLLALGRPLEAENSFVMAVVEFPGEWRYWEALARAFEKNGKKESALTAMRNAERLKPKYIPQFRGFETTRKDILKAPSAGVPKPWINWSYRH